MKGKHTKKKKNTGFHWLLIVFLLLVVGFAVLWIAAMKQGLPNLEATASSENSASETSSSAESMKFEESFQPINLGYGVSLENAGAYTGIYMEDGSNELVFGVMMILVKNAGENDIQLMNITVSFGEESYRFMLTNLPVGASAVLLELNRAQMPEGKLISAVAENVVLFPEPMQADFECYEISGMSGAMNVKNISGRDISGDIYVYYKYKNQDVYYGGITFRVGIQGGLKADEIRQIMTSHFNPETCEILVIDVIERNGN